MALLSKSGIATIAVATGLVLTAGTGGAVAGAMITGKQIKNNTVTTKDIKNNNLTGADVADGSVDSADLSAAVRSGLGDLTVSGAVSKSGVLTVFRAPTGTTVTALADPGTPGYYCITVTGGPRAVNPQTAGLVASPNYKDDNTNVGTRNAIIESSTRVNDTNCAGGFRVVTLLRDGANTALDQQPFLFQIN